MNELIKTFLGEVKLSKTFTDIIPGFIFTIALLLLLDPTKDSPKNYLDEKNLATLLVLSVVFGTIISQLSRVLFIEFFYTSFLPKKLKRDINSPLIRSPYYYIGLGQLKGSDYELIISKYYNYAEASVNNAIPIIFLGLSCDYIFHKSWLLPLCIACGILLVINGFFAFKNYKNRVADLILGSLDEKPKTNECIGKALEMANSNIITIRVKGKISKRYYDDLYNETNSNPVWLLHKDCIENGVRPSQDDPTKGKKLQVDIETAGNYYEIIGGDVEIVCGQWALAAVDNQGSILATSELLTFNKDSNMKEYIFSSQLGGKKHPLTVTFLKFPENIISPKVVTSNNTPLPLKKVSQAEKKEIFGDEIESCYIKEINFWYGTTNGQHTVGKYIKSIPEIVIVYES